MMIQKRVTNGIAFTIGSVHCHLAYLQYLQIEFITDALLNLENRRVDRELMYALTCVALLSLRISWENLTLAGLFCTVEMLQFYSYFTLAFVVSLESAVVCRTLE